MQQDAWPARPKHHGHRAGRGWPCVQVHQRRSHRVSRIFLQQGISEIGVAITSTATAAASFAAAVLFDDDCYRESYQRPDIGGNHTIATGHQHHIVFSGEAGHHLHHTRILGARHALYPFQQFDLFGGVQRHQRIVRQIQGTAAVLLHAAGNLDLASALAGDGAGCYRGIVQGAFGDFIGIRKSGLVAGNGAHAYSLIDRKTTGLDDAFFQAPAFALGELEVQVGVIDLVREHGPQRLQQARFVEAERSQQDIARNG